LTRFSGKTGSFHIMTEPRYLYGRLRQETRHRTFWVVRRQHERRSVERVNLRRYSVRRT